jgi:lipopolysaccharide/colanic/teichoic acid biosynthesis glycosyltransferase
MMTSEQIQMRMIRRLHGTQTFWGRARLTAYVRIKRLAWLMLVNGTYIAKRTIDIILSLVAMILASPILIIVAILIKLDGGPIFFGQTRVGLYGLEFKMLKFRSMCVDAEARLAALLAQNEKSQGVTFKIKNDPRITKIGRFIRKTSLDEVPQFINVIRGEMSLVGPRPALPREVALYSEADRRRLLALPGLTCFWQVGEREGRLFEIGDRNSIDFDEQVSLDVRYIESQSVFRDIWLLCKTIPAVLLGKGM